MKSGTEAVLDLIGFDQMLEDTDIVVTGEGRTDWQSCFGKVMQGVGDHAKRYNVPVIALCGGLGPGYEAIYDHGIDSIMTSVDGPMELAEALEHAEELYYKGAVRMFRLLKAGMRTAMPETRGRDMDLSQYDGKYIRLEDIYGDTFTGRASHGNHGFLMHEYGSDEDGLFIEDHLICNSQIRSIEEIRPHGTAELWTERLVLRRYTMEDAEPLYKRLGSDPEISEYSGWNPYATLETARETVRGFIDSYDDEHSYSWVMDIDDVLVGTIGAYDYKADPDGAGDRIEVGYSIVRDWQGRGLATKALTKVLEYLTENEGISCVTAWCAPENAGSVRVLEKSGMKLAGIEKDGITAGNKTYDKLIYEYNILREQE